MSYDPSQYRLPPQGRWPQATPPEAWPSYRDGDVYQDEQYAEAPYGADGQGAYQATGHHRQAGYQRASGESGDPGYRSAVATDTFGYAGPQDDSWDARDGYGRAGNGYDASGYATGGYPGGASGYADSGYADSGDGFDGAPYDYGGNPGNGYAGTADGYAGTADGYAGAFDRYTESGDGYARGGNGYGGATDGYSLAEGGYGRAEGGYGRAASGEYGSDSGGYDWNGNGYDTVTDGFDGNQDGLTRTAGYPRQEGYAEREDYPEPVPSGRGLMAPDAGLHPESWQADQDRRRESGRRGLVVGAITGLLTVAIAIGVSTLAAAFIRPQAAPITAIGDVFVDRMPSALKTLAMGQAGSHGRTALLLLMYLAIACLALGLGAASRRAAALAVAGLAAGTMLSAFIVITRAEGRMTDVIPAIIGGVAGVAALLWLQRASAPLTPVQPARGGPRRSR